MAEAEPPDRHDARKDTLRARSRALAGGLACLFVGVVLGLALDQYITVGGFSEMRSRVLVFVLSLAGVIEIAAIIYYAWRLHQLRRLGDQRSSEEIQIAEPVMTPLPWNNDEKVFQIGHIWNFYVEFGLMERHFNQIQSNYRRLASTWLLAAFAAIGFVLSTKLTILIPPELFILALGIAGGVGVYLIWVIDLLVNQRLLDASFIQAKDLETTYTWLPQIRNNMRKLLRGKGLRLVLWFYIGGTEAMALTGGVGLLLWLSKISIPVFIICLTMVDYVIGMFLVLMIMRAKTKITPNFEAQRRASGFR